MKQKFEAISKISSLEDLPKSLGVDIAFLKKTKMINNLTRAFKKLNEIPDDLRSRNSSSPEISSTCGISLPAQSRHPWMSPLEIKEILLTTSEMHEHSRIFSWRCQCQLYEALRSSGVVALVMSTSDIVPKIST